MSDLAGSYEDYKSAYPNDDPPFSLHLRRIGLGGFSIPFLNRTALNYQRGIGAHKKLEEDCKALQEGRLESRFPGGFPNIDFGSLEYKRVEDRIKEDLESLERNRILGIKRTFNSDSNTEEINYELQKFYTDAIWFYQRRIDLYVRQIFPLLEPGEVIKPQDTRFLYLSALAPTISNY